MTEDDALAAFGALAHPIRIKVFRMLSERGPERMSAGDLATTLDVPPSTLSTHLARLEDAGLIDSQRRSRNILYGLNVTGARALVDYLVTNCCQGRPDLCGVVPKQADPQLT